MNLVEYQFVVISENNKLINPTIVPVILNHLGLNHHQNQINSTTVADFNCIVNTGF